MRFITTITVLLFIIACNKNDDINDPPPPITNYSKISIENGQFIKSNGEVLFIWGLNYTNPESIGLIEDDWLNETTWQTIKSDFKEMKALGANVIRIHLQYHQFMIDATTPNTLALERLKELVQYAEEEKLYLDITGLSAYRIMDQPAYYTNLTDEARWETQKVFWQNIAKTVDDNQAVLAYNLMNEPVVSVGCEIGSDCAWTPGNGFGGFYFVQNITRNPGNDVQSTLKSWIADMTQAIRSEDSNTLITVGFLALGNFKQYDVDLDYLSPHIYPASGEIQSSIMKVLDNQTNVPLVIEETSNLNCNIGELEEFLTGIDGKYNGLMGHYHGKPIAELNDFDLKEAIQKNFLQFFRDKNPN